MCEPSMDRKIIQRLSKFKAYRLVVKAGLFQGRSSNLVWPGEVDGGSKMGQSSVRIISLLMIVILSWR